MIVVPSSIDKGTPVLGFASNLGWLLLLIERRRRWLVGNTKDVFHNDTRILYTTFGLIGIGTFWSQLKRHLIRWMPSCTSCDVPSGWTSLRRTAKSVSLTFFVELLIYFSLLYFRFDSIQSFFFFINFFLKKNENLQSSLIVCKIGLM